MSMTSLAMPSPSVAAEGLLRVGTPVFYFSRSSGRWVPAVVLGYNEVHGGQWWSYRLDVQPQAPPTHVVPRTLASHSLASLMPASGSKTPPAGSVTKCAVSTTASSGWSARQPVASGSLTKVPTCPLLAECSGMESARSLPQAGPYHADLVSQHRTSPTQRNFANVGHVQAAPAAVAAGTSPGALRAPVVLQPGSLQLPPASNLQLPTPSPGTTTLRRGSSPPSARALPAWMPTSPPTARAVPSTPPRALSVTRGVPQRGCGPELWGITLNQLKELANDPRHTDSMTTRDVVEKIIKPDTAGTGAGYALLKNSDRPLRAAIMVSHAWDAKYADLVAAIAASGEVGPFWVCATALYQPEDIPEVTLERQLGAEAGGPLTAVLGQAAAVLCVLTAACNIYTRLWCLFEIFTAGQLGVEVRVTSKQRKFGLGPFDELLLLLCKERIDSSRARCGFDQASGRVDDMAIRGAIEASPGGHKAVDTSVEAARLTALVYARDRLVGGGWKDTTIMRQYDDAINVVSQRLGKVVGPPANHPDADEVPSSTGRTMQKAWSDANLTVATPPVLSSARGDAHVRRQSGPPVSATPPSARVTINTSGKFRTRRPQANLLQQPGPSTPRSTTRQKWAQTTSL